MDPLQWMGAVRMRVQSADKNHHNNPLHSSTSITIWSEKLHICKKQIHQDIVYFKPKFWLKWDLYSQHWFLLWKSRLVWIRREICKEQASFTSKIIVRGKQRMDFFHWRKHYYELSHILARSNGLKMSQWYICLWKPLFSSQDYGLKWCRLL